MFRHFGLSKNTVNPMKFQHKLLFGGLRKTGILHFTLVVLSFAPRLHKIPI